MKILVVGSGAREHALVWKIQLSPLVSELYCAPGNSGTAMLAENVDIPAANVRALALWALENGIDLTIVGPEEPLALGIVDVFREHGLRIFGPTREAAQLESSKSFAKDVLQRAGVRTPDGAVFSDYDLACAYLTEIGAPVVIKADGLAAGKGVVVAETMDQALGALRSFLVDKRFGESSARVVIEQMIVGEEASLIAMVDGEHVLPFAPAQDFKRLKAGDKGPNTGGMGAISPTAVLAGKRIENLVGEIFIPVLAELRTRGIRYQGFLYAGVLVDANGVVWVLEFNCRLGDPETEVLMLRLQSDIVAAISSATRGALATVELNWKHEASACVVLASPGYPDAPILGGTIELPSTADPSSFVFHAGTRAGEDGALVTSGGRVLVVSALGESLDVALRHVYSTIESVRFEGMQFRTDIGGGASIKVSGR